LPSRPSATDVSLSVYFIACNPAQLNDQHYYQSLSVCDAVTGRAGDT